MTDQTLQRYNLLSLATEEGIWDYNLETKNVYYNSTISRLFGYNKKDMRDNFSWWRDNLHPSDKKRVIKRLDLLLQGDESAWWGEYQFRCKNGTYKWVLEKLYVVRDSRGKPYRIVGTMQELTRIKALEKKGEAFRIKQQREITKAIVKAEEEEKKEISDELIENINQVLAAINLHMDQLKRELRGEGKTASLNEVQHLLRKSIEDIRSVSRRLTPAGLPFFGLVSYVEELLEAMRKRTGLRFHFRHAGYKEIDDKEKKLLLYRIVQLQLKNIREHASAKVVHLQLENAGSKVKLSIRDNGAGFDDARLKFGYGFSRIQSLTEAFDGSFSIKGRPGKGCRLEVML